jgi:hypothetical protein
MTNKEEKKKKSQAKGIIPSRNPELLLQCEEEKKRARVWMGQESEFLSSSIIIC